MLKKWGLVTVNGVGVMSDVSVKWVEKSNSWDSERRLGKAWTVKVLNAYVRK